MHALFGETSAPSEFAVAIPAWSRRTVEDGIHQVDVPELATPDETSKRIASGQVSEAVQLEQPVSRPRGVDHTPNGGARSCQRLLTEHRQPALDGGYRLLGVRAAVGRNVPGRPDRRRAARRAFRATAAPGARRAAACAVPSQGSAITSIEAAPLVASDARRWRPIEPTPRKPRRGSRPHRAISPGGAVAIMTTPAGSAPSGRRHRRGRGGGRPRARPLYWSGREVLTPRRQSVPRRR